MKFPAELLKHCWVVAGPTAVGKTATSLQLAERINGEILSLDSMAVYRSMDIGTAKASRSEQTRVRHHLIDLVDPHQDYSVAEYCDAAAAAVLGILDRGHIPLFVGGTGLYLKALLRGLFDGPPADWELRRRLEQRAQQLGPETLLDDLRAVDPVTAARLHVNDQRRVIRALEVYQATGRPLSEQHQDRPRPVEERPRMVLWLEPPRDWLRSRIDQRVDIMMQQGLLDETKQLLRQNPGPGRTARQALGYRELIAHLEDQLPLAEAVELIKVRTRQFAKRQHTWFRNLEECTCLPLTGQETADQICDLLLNRAGADSVSGP